MDAVLGWFLVSVVVGGVAVLFGVKRKAASGRPPLELEWLGVRITPAAHTWSGLGTTANVSDAANWTGGPVVGGDTLTFDGSLGAASNKSATWDAAAPGGVNSITVSGAYTGTVEVAANLSTMTLNQTATAGLLTVDAGDTLSAYTYLLNASALYGPGSVYANSMTVAGGAYISGTNKVTVGGNLQVNGTVTLDNTATLINVGTISAWNGGQINVLAGSQIINSGTFTVQCDQTLHGVNGKFNNPGTFIKNGTPGTTDINITFNNQPLAGYTAVCKVTANSGKLEFDRPGSQAGEFDANTPAVMEFSASTQTLAPGTMFGGSGSVVVDGSATLSAGAGVVVDVGTTNFELGFGGTLGGVGTYKITSLFKWDGGEIANATVTASGFLNITGANASSMTDAGLTILGATTTWDSTADIDMTSSSITNEGAFTAKNNQKIDDQGGATMSVFINQADGQGHRGTFTKAASALPTIFNVDVQNAADFYFSGSQISFEQHFNQTGTNSTTHLDGGTMLLTTYAFDLGGGTLFGAGTIQGSITVEGTIDLGSAVGNLGITGNYTENATGVLKIKIGGAGAGQYDTLSVGGTATLGGAVQVTLIGGFTPLPTDQFQILVAFGGVAGNFGTVTPGWTSTPGATDDILSSP